MILDLLTLINGVSLPLWHVTPDLMITGATGPGLLMFGFNYYF